MKTFFTLIFSLGLLLNSYSQNNASTNSKDGTVTSGIIIESPVFSIIKAYPNPVKDILFVDVFSKTSAQVQIVLYNILGSEIQKWEPGSILQGEQKLKIDLSFAKTGIYILNMSSSGKVCTKVIKKN